MAAVTNAAPATAAVATPFGTRWNNWVDGVFSRVVTQLDFSKSFSLTLEDAGDVKADGVAKKIVKMVALFIPLLAFSAFALVGSALSTVKACLCAKTAETNAEEKKPADAPEKTSENEEV